MKKYLYIFLMAILLVLASPALASDTPNVYFFHGDGCPHCAKEEIFLDQLHSKDPSLNIYAFEVWKNKSNLNLLKEVGQALDADVSGVPFTVIGDNYVSGFLNA